jgi:hypothetical protein
VEELLSAGPDRVARVAEVQQVRNQVCEQTRSTKRRTQRTRVSECGGDWQGTQGGEVQAETRSEANAASDKTRHEPDRRRQSLSPLENPMEDSSGTSEGRWSMAITSRGRAPPCKQTNRHRTAREHGEADSVE